MLACLCLKYFICPPLSLSADFQHGPGLQNVGACVQGPRQVGELRWCRGVRACGLLRFSAFLQCSRARTVPGWTVGVVTSGSFATSHQLHGLLDFTCCLSLLFLSISIYLSVSLSHTHTHTHTCPLPRQHFPHVGEHHRHQICVGRLPLPQRLLQEQP